jgi:beta-lactamase regulating signal transducer with metallopeptidase domain
MSEAHLNAEETKAVDNVTREANVALRHGRIGAITSVLWVLGIGIVVGAAAALRERRARRRAAAGASDPV